MNDQRSARIRVTGPRTGRARRTSIASEIDAGSTVGEVYMRSLMRSQLRLAVGVTALMGLTVGALPLLFGLSPWLRRAELLGVPVPWLLLGLGAYPVLIALAWFYVRRAERNEDVFKDMVGGGP